MGLAFALGVLPSWSEVWQFFNQGLSMPTNPADKSGWFCQIFFQKKTCETKSYGHCLGFPWISVSGTWWSHDFWGNTCHFRMGSIHLNPWGWRGRSVTQRTKFGDSRYTSWVAATVSVSNSLGIDFFQFIMVHYGPWTWIFQHRSLNQVTV